MWHSGDGMGWWMVWGGLMMIFFWGAIIALVVWAAQSGAAPSRTPLEIAKERYARGEIGRDEFEQMKRDLEET